MKSIGCNILINIMCTSRLMKVKKDKKKEKKEKRAKADVLAAAAISEESMKKKKKDKVGFSQEFLICSSCNTPHDGNIYHAYRCTSYPVLFRVERVMVPVSWSRQYRIRSLDEITVCMFVTCTNVYFPHRSVNQRRLQRCLLRFRLKRSQRSQRFDGLCLDLRIMNTAIYVSLTCNLHVISNAYIVSG